MAVSVEAAAEEASSLVLCDTEAEPPATTFRWALNTSTGLTNLGPRRSDIISHLIFFLRNLFSIHFTFVQIGGAVTDKAQDQVMTSHPRM